MFNTGNQIRHDDWMKEHANIWQPHSMPVKQYISHQIHFLEAAMCYNEIRLNFGWQFVHQIFSTRRNLFRCCFYSSENHLHEQWMSMRWIVSPFNQARFTSHSHFTLRSGRLNTDTYVKVRWTKKKVNWNQFILVVMLLGMSSFFG